MRLNTNAFAISAAIIGALFMLILGILANVGLYLGAALMMIESHLFFNLTPLGILGGMIESAIISFIVAWFFAIIYHYCPVKI